MARGKKSGFIFSVEEKLQRALIPVEDQPYEIPENWCWVHLSDLSEVISKGTTPRGGKDAYVSEGVNFLRVENINDDGTISHDNIAHITEEMHTGFLKRSVLQKDDILVSIAGTLGKTGIVQETDLPLNTNQAVSFIRLKDECINRSYIKASIDSPVTQELLLGKTKVTSIPNLTLEIIGDCLIPLCPLAEQQRIVDRIESIFAKLDEAKEKAQAVVDSYELRKSAILYSAFSGELTKQWREDHSPAKEDFAKEARNKRDEAIRKNRAKQLKYSMPDDVALFDIPDSWQFLQMGDIAWSIKDGPHFSPEYVEDGIPFITGGNVRPNGVDFDSAKRITPELHAELCKRCRPEKNDMLYTKGGTTGIARVNTYDIEFSVWVHVAVIKFVDTVLPQYFQYVLNSPYCYEQSQKYTHGVGNQDLGLTRMINILFPVCSIAEQKEIIAILDDLLEKEEQVKSAAETIVEQIDTMKKAVLAHAFRGELGTNDPTEESAVELLKTLL